MKLSIVIPAYNVEKHIYNTLESLINQTEKQFEIIIVDDGSIDRTYNNTKGILLKNKFPNYKIIKKENGGVSSARNRGLYEATGRYILFLDGDDYVSKDLVETINKHIKNQEPEAICWGYNMVKEDKTTIMNYFNKYNSKLINITGIDALNNIIIDKTMWICTGSVAYRRDFLFENGLKYTEGCPNGEDQEFAYKALSKADKVIFINKVLSYYVQREGSISNTYNIKRFDAINAMKRTYEYIESINNWRLKKIANTIKNENIIENYLYNFNSCLTCLLSNNDISKKVALNNIYSDIEKNYPELNEDIISNMKAYKGNNLKLLINIRAFLISPLMYYWLVNLKSKLKVFRDG